MAITNGRALYFSFGTSDINYEVAHNFRASLDEKRKSHLKLLKDKILQVNCSFLLFNFGLFSHRQIFISKIVTLALAYVSITNNLKLTTTFLTVKPLICEFQILIHDNDFRIYILFQHISVTFIEEKQNK